MEWLNNIISTYKKGLEYDKLQFEHERLSSEYDYVYTELKKLQEKLASLNKTIDVDSLKEWYEGRRESDTWSYNGQRLGKKDVKVYLTPSDDTPFKTLAQELITKYNLTKDNSSTEVVDGMYKYWNLKSSWYYKTDLQLYGNVEWWEDPTEALNNRRGDCESKAMCMYNTAYWMLSLLGKESSTWRLTFICSHVLGEGGHGYCTWLGDDGEYYVVESTYDNIQSKSKTWLVTPIRYNNLYNSFWGFATRERSWKGSNSAFMKFE